MTRTEGDSWDLASGVGATATLVAVGRALASTEHDALIHDPFAAPLVRAVGVDYFTRLLAGGTVDPASPQGTVDISGLITPVMAVRTRFFDDYCLAADATGIRQVVILASGLDSRPYRIGWSAGTVVYEIDKPEVIGFKTETMESIGAIPTAQRCAVAIDLREDWPAALRRSGFDADAPTTWLAEGLVMYLPHESQDRLFDSITALSAPGSQLATDYHPDGGAGVGGATAHVTHPVEGQAFGMNASTLFYPGPRKPVADYLIRHGWRAVQYSRAELFDSYGRTLPATDVFAPLSNSLTVVATR
ncbi:methyltransferase (TIGR00027 family) [Mycolicibacterium sp. BK634]|uniref:class I SAM-dependent methyltransferase n=1 Tax=Mycolicibacterium sp. BK634 TaxID=2587099 RepID=UPI00161AE71F|nr:class I SAM-dependent methyltransferase [Mycolicibacterium sp. BK634]MBB3753575.1 methyltransferase (TIGR00027 family) [Mycolicibacterium sp. BK634]